MLMPYFDAYATAYVPYKDGEWCYEDGCIYRGLACLHAATGEDRWLAHLARLVDARLGPDGPTGYDPGEFNIDNVLPARALIYLWSVTGAPRYLEAARPTAGQLAQHPRTRSGVYWHKRIYPRQVWLDGLYMGLPFQIEWAQAAGDAGLVDDALTQVVTALELTAEPATGLYAHGHDESRNQAWSDPRTGRSAAHWARALGWLAMTLVDVAELVGPERFRAAGLEAPTAGLLTRLTGLRTPGGLWLQVIDQPGLAGNYEESSASAMLAYALLKAGRLGLAAGVAGAGREALAALEERAMVRDAAGRLALGRICHVAGLGGYLDRYRDGSPEYYLREPIVSDDPKGVGPLMMAGAERSRLPRSEAPAGRGDHAALDQPRLATSTRAS